MYNVIYKEKGVEHDKIKTKVKTMVNNENIVKKIREFGSNAGLKTDMAICKKCKFSNRTQLGKMATLKTAPQLDTIAKFAEGLGIQIEDLIYDRTDADRELSKWVAKLTEYEKTEVVVYIKMMLKEKNQEQRMVA